MSKITLYEGIPWGSSPLHIIDFTNEAERESYFSNFRNKLELPNIDWDFRRSQRLNLDLTLIEADKYNYMRWEDDNGQVLYFFIHDAELLNNNKTCQFFVSEDIWTNEQFSVQFMPSKVHRRHMARWQGSTPILYPVDEGNPRSQGFDTLLNVNNGNYVVLVLIASKDFGLGAHPEGTVYYYSVINKNGESVTITRNGESYTMLNPLDSQYLGDLSNLGVAPSDVVGWFACPYSSLFGSNWDFTKVQIAAGFQLNPTSNAGVLVAQNYPQTPQTEQFSISPSWPSKASYSSQVTWTPDYEVQAFGDNMARVAITDINGTPIVNLPKDILFDGSQYITLYQEYNALQPQLRIVLNGYGAPNGTSLVIPCPPVDFPQSKWQDYLIQSYSADKQILQNNIESGRAQTIVSGISQGIIAGAIAGGGIGGVASAGASMVTSLINASIQERTEWSNFSLNTQKIRNTSTPPVGGNNFWTIGREGVRIIELTPDAVSRRIVASNYHYFGVIVDQSMPINLRTRKYFDFIQTQNVSIYGSFDQDKKDYLQSLFNAGVTVWHGDNLISIGNYTYDNTERA